MMDGDKFAEALLAERSFELCFEGQRFYDLRRWASDVSELNGTIRRPVITPAGTTFTEVEKRSYTSLYVPIPYSEMVRMKGLVQNEGWSNWE